MGKLQAADVLLQESDFTAGAIPHGYSQHRGRPIHGERRDTPASAQIAGEKAGAATEIRRRAEIDAVAPDELFKSSARADKKWNSQGGIVHCRQFGIRTSDSM